MAFKVKIKSLPKDFVLKDGKVFKQKMMGGNTGDQSGYGLVTYPTMDDYKSDKYESIDVSSKINTSLSPVPRDIANLEAERGETVLTDFNNDGKFELYSIGGKRHSQGGTPLNLPPQSFIYSDTAAMKLDTFELNELGIDSKKKITPAQVSRKYQLNKFIGILDDESTDKITRDTAEYMLNKNKQSLSQLAFLSEAKKDFEEGVPLAAYPYLQKKGLDPIRFSQEVEGITRDLAQKKMIAQLPVEYQAELQRAEEQMQMAQQMQMEQQDQAMSQQMQMPADAPVERPMAQGGLEFNYNIDPFPSDNTRVVIPNLPILNENVSNTEESQLPVDPFENIVEDYKTEESDLADNYKKDMEALLASYIDNQNKSLQFGMSATYNSNIPNDDVVKVWEKHIKEGGPAPSNPDINYNTAYKNINGELPQINNESSDQPGGNTTIIMNQPTEESSDGTSPYGLQYTSGSTEGPIFQGDEQGAPYNISEGKPMDVASPFGSPMTFNFGRNGFELPTAKKGIEYNGYTYSKRKLEQLRTSDDPAQRQLYMEIMNGGPILSDQQIANQQTSKINQSRIDTEGRDAQTILSGNDEWMNNYQTNEALRSQRYKNYVKTLEREAPELTPYSEEEYHKQYDRFQRQNRWMNENFTKEELDSKAWDSKYNYVDGQKDRSNKRGRNWKYNEIISQNEEFTPFTEEEIKHVQAGYIGGLAMNLAGNEDASLSYDGVADQTVFGKSVTPVDGVWGNTMNRQLESTNIEKIDAVPCSNAAEMEAQCAEVGGVWTPFNPEDGSGCECSKEIKEKPKEEIIERDDPDAPFWIQDELGISNAMDAKFSLKKRYPWAPTYDLVQIDPVFKDPTREIAAIGEQAVIAANTASTFAGPQRAAAVQAKAQGVAAAQIANAMNKVQSDNVTIANQVNQKNAELQYKTQVLNNTELKNLYDNTMLTEQNYDNALRQANEQITKQLQNAYTNRANTYNLNTIYPQFNIDPRTGGMIEVTDTKEFYADPNYQDPQDAVDRYTTIINKLDEAGVPEEQWPTFQMPKQSSGTTFAQNNAATITSGYNPTGTATGRRGTETKEQRRNRLLRKGGQMRMWFSPLRGN